jgi:casein kinase 1
MEVLHERHYIYHDIKPENFLIGRGSNQGTIFLTDCGLAKRYRDPETKRHSTYREGRSLVGTARYMSINVHLMREQSRRDDLESLGYVFVYFTKGRLPWQGIPAEKPERGSKRRYEQIGEKKQEVSVEALCDGLPVQFAIYLRYVRALGFEDQPDYRYLRDLFTEMIRHKGEEEGQFDWHQAIRYARRTRWLSRKLGKARVMQGDRLTGTGIGHELRCFRRCKSDLSGVQTNDES